MTWRNLTQRQRERARELAIQRALRRTDGLYIYRPQPIQEEFHRSLASERLVRGGNQSGKSMCSFAEFASAATGIPIIGGDGKPIPSRFPQNRPLKMWVIGYDEKHIGQTIYRMLFTRDHGLEMIRDLETGKWRDYRPWEPADKARESEKRPAGPYIPKRFIESFSFKDKSAKVFTSCQLKSRWPEYSEGTIIYAYSSKAEAKMGDQVDVILIDEDIRFAQHYPEWQARISKRKGCIIWSAYPHTSNMALTDLTDRAEKQVGMEKPDVQEFRLVFSENPFMDEDEKRKRLAGWNDEERAARDRGEYRFGNTLVYPNFSAKFHGIEQDQGPEDKIAQILRDSGGQPPANWTRELILDPGHSQAAILFGAIPPPELGDWLVWYDELYPRHKSAHEVAQMVIDRSCGQSFHRFIIDYRAGRQSLIGMGGHTIAQQYSQAFAAAGLRCAMTGSSFIFGSDDVSGRIGLVRSAMCIRGDGTSRFRIVEKTTKNGQREFSRYMKRVVANEVKEEPVDRHNHLMNCLEYWIASRPQYVVPMRTENQWSPAYRDFLRMKDELAAKSRDDGSVWMGAGTPAA